MTKPIAYIQDYGRSAPMHEFMLAAWQGFEWDKYEIRFVGADYIHRMKDVNPSHPLVGTVELTQQFFKNNGLALPAPLNVPEELLPYAGRTIERMTFDDFLSQAIYPRFIKPADSVKLFTGGVLNSANTAALAFSDVPLDANVLVSPEIDLVSEYRLFINRDREIVAMRHYSGDAFVRPSRLFVRKMIDAYTQSPRSYSLDVGITASGKTVVVECNDFWALGTYGMYPLAYSRMLAQRWHEMITNITK